MTLAPAEMAKALRVLERLAHEVFSSLQDAATDLELLAAEAGDETPRRMHLDGCVGAPNHAGKCWFYRPKDQPEA